MNDQNRSQSYQVVMPRLGLTMTEGRVIDWLAAEGTWVEKGTPLFTIENEKSTLDIEAPASGYLHIQAPVDSVVPILAPVALLEGSDEVTSAHHSVVADSLISSVSVKKEALTAQKTTTEKDKEQSGIRATPKARLEARRQGMDLVGKTGSGLRDMLVFEDIRQMIQNQTVRATPVARKLAEAGGINMQGISGTGPRGIITRQDVEKMALSSQPPVVQVSSSRDIRGLSGLRAVIADRLSTGWRERPQVTLTTDADATFFAAARRQMNAELALQYGENAKKISLNAMLVRLVAIALREYPYINVQLTSNGIQTMPEINIGVAVDTDRGLLVPVVRKAADKNLIEINDDLGSLIERALTGSSMPDDLSGGTFTITNLGMYDIDAFTPIINPPECAILGVGRIQSRPVGLDGQIVLRERMALSLSFDHRLVDGAPAGKFLQRIKQLIERPFILTLMNS